MPWTIDNVLLSFSDANIDVDLKCADVCNACFLCAAVIRELLKNSKYICVLFHPLCCPCGHHHIKKNYLEIFDSSRRLCSTIPWLVGKT